MATPNFARNQAAFKVVVGDLDVTEKLNPYLIAIVVRFPKAASPTADLELDDSGGQLSLPSEGSSVTIDLGWDGWGVGRVFEGTVAEVTSEGSRAAGRLLIVHCDGSNFGGPAASKEQHQLHKDNATFKDVAVEWAAKAGLQAMVHSDLANKVREYWGMTGESFVHWGQRMADELGAKFTIEGNKAAFVPKIGGQSVTGRFMSGITADFKGPDGNGIAWRIIPVVSRPPFASFTGKFFDMVKAKWDKATTEGALGAVSSAMALLRWPEADKDAATDAGKGAAAGTYANSGTGTVTIVGDPDAQPGGSLTVVGAREGVDGEYQIDELEHRYRRAEGFITTCGLQAPGGSLIAKYPQTGSGEVGVHPGKDEPVQT